MGILKGINIIQKKIRRINNREKQKSNIETVDLNPTMSVIIKR